MSKCLIVTGGGRGIGAEVSRKAVKQGYSVCVNFHRDQTSAQKLVCELEENGTNAMAYQADVSQEEEVEALFQTVEKHLGTPEALVNNAGILDLQTRVDGMNAERIQRIFSVNVTGSFLCAREAVKRMSTKYGGTGFYLSFFFSGFVKSSSVMGFAISCILDSLFVCLKPSLAALFALLSASFFSLLACFSIALAPRVDL